MLAFTSTRAARVNLGTIPVANEHIGLQIDGERLWKNIMATSQLGLIPGTTGMNRQALSEADMHVRDWFCKEARSFGCEIEIDTIGNIFAILPGKNNQVPPIGIGSHLDTQPAGEETPNAIKYRLTLDPGGRFDGILGVIGALEVLRTIKSSGIKHYAPIAAVNWTNE
jgi:N-carbamoyl-L-amino-acid hydrolase